MQSLTFLWVNALPVPCWSTLIGR